MTESHWLGIYPRRVLWYLHDIKFLNTWRSFFQGRVERLLAWIPAPLSHRLSAPWAYGTANKNSKAETHMDDHLHIGFYWIYISKLKIASSFVHTVWVERSHWCHSSCEAITWRQDSKIEWRKLPLSKVTRDSILSWKIAVVFPLNNLVMIFIAILLLYVTLSEVDRWIRQIMKHWSGWHLCIVAIFCIAEAALKTMIMQCPSVVVKNHHHWRLLRRPNQINVWHGQNMNSKLFRFSPRKSNLVFL